MPLPAVDTNRDSAVSRDKRLDGLPFDPFCRVSYPVERHRAFDEGELYCSILCTVIISSPDPGVKPHSYVPFLDRVSGTGGLILRA